MPNKQQLSNFSRVSAQFLHSTHFNSKTTGTLLIIFLFNVGALLELLMRPLTKQYGICSGMPEQSVKVADFLTFSKPPKSNWLL